MNNLSTAFSESIGYGPPLSNIKMPQYQHDESYLYEQGGGSIEPLQNITSTIQDGWTRSFYVYLPPDYSESSETGYNTVYTADGYEALTFDRAKNVLDFLHAKELIDPTIVVFVSSLGMDHLLPIPIERYITGSCDVFDPNLDENHCVPPPDSYNLEQETNWRIQDYLGDSVGIRLGKYLGDDCTVELDPILHPGQKNICQKKYGEFLANELVPFIDSTYNTKNDSNSRAHIGVSAGGILSAYIGSSHSDTFKLIGSQSGSFWHGSYNSIKTFFQTNEKIERMRFYLNAGIFENWQCCNVFDSTVAFARILESKGYPTMLRLFNEGHTHFQWMRTLAQMLVYLFSDDPADYNYSLTSLRGLPESVVNEATTPLFSPVLFIALVIIVLRRKNRNRVIFNDEASGL